MTKGSIDRESVVTQIRRLAASNDGRVSFDFFITETGIPAQRLRGQTWFKSWNMLLDEIGISTATFSKPRTPDVTVAAAVAELIKKISSWPTEDDFRREKKLNPSFPAISVIRKVKKAGRLLPLLRQYCAEDASLGIVERIIAEQSETLSLVENLGRSGDSDRVKGYVYMQRYGRQYKIGHTNTPVRRFREVSLELPNETVLVHSIQTDDPIGIEKYWHTRFSAKRVRTSEWFDLDADDVRVFKRRIYQ